MRFLENKDKMNDINFKIDGEDIGYIQYIFGEGNVIYLEKINILEKYRNRNGYGKILLNKFNLFLEKTNNIGILLDNCLYDTFYKNMGWKEYMDGDLIYVYIPRKRNIYKEEEFIKNSVNILINYDLK